MPQITVIIPAYNEALSIGKVVAGIPRELVQQVIVVDNNSTDSTGQVATQAGATVVWEPRQGYGQACLTGIAHALNQVPPPDIILFMDGDFSDYPEEIPLVLHPLLTQGYDLVIGSRALGQREPGSMTIPQIFGNWLATTLLRSLYNARFTDLGPFRAISTQALCQLNMQDRTYGWTVEMQLKAAQQNIRYTEVPVTYRKRIGVSKISGTVKGVVLAGYKILWTIGKHYRRK
ncbi:glycosyltransferase family 2 protein [Rufibacter glacialis]|uniref:Glycosyltransferase family 2 protein n=1 Tax=Rufibacter glacialis TaxID=1259555 RepID=A0A5M8QBT4_9BACT|nr:glycosyltransferase family 2 protein [Rufibacter glacialis]KAA6432553.1 glycosyltransferase family 2 protein [Rufibacter glacialis]